MCHCAFSLSLLSVLHWSDGSIWHGANSRQIEGSQPFVRYSLHIIPKHMTTAALCRHRGRAVNCTVYIMKRGGRNRKREGFYWEVSQCIIVHKANRLPVTRSGWGPILTDLHILMLLPGGEACRIKCLTVLWWNLTKHKFHVIHYVQFVLVFFCEQYWLYVVIKKILL